MLLLTLVSGNTHTREGCYSDSHAYYSQVLCYIKSVPYVYVVYYGTTYGYFELPD